MDFFGVLTMLGGLALFLYGMMTMGEGLAAVSGGRLDNILRRVTQKKWRALLLGSFVTAVIQSSSAVTVMVVGLVNSGIMELYGAASVIMGANVGTTFTSWILSLTGLTGSSFWVRIFKPSSFSPVIALIGIVFIMTSKDNYRKRIIGNILMGFAILMFGMETMSTSVKPLASDETFCSLLTMFSHPLLGMTAGALVTAVIQSSSASVGILQALCISGAVEFKSAIPIILGQNIGTCVTALVSSIGTNENARKASFIHLYFNLIGTLIFMSVFYGINSLLHFEFMDLPASAFDIALIHTIFNVGSAVILYPFSDILVKLAHATVE